MEKDFDKWNELAKKLQQREARHSFMVGDIWWCSLGVNIGDEQDGKNELFERPVLIVKVFSNSFVRIVPLTSVIKKDKYHVEIIFLNRPQTAILSQLRSISTKRLFRFAGVIDEPQFVTIVNALKQELI